jgi:hypothetical protein
MLPLWHESDVPRCPRNVRYRRYIGSEILAASISSFDPFETLSFSRWMPAAGSQPNLPSSKHAPSERLTSPWSAAWRWRRWCRCSATATCPGRRRTQTRIRPSPAATGQLGTRFSIHIPEAPRHPAIGRHSAVIRKQLDWVAEAAHRIFADAFEIKIAFDEVGEGA